jgi:exodeoxyribonuclease VII large subunit
MKQGDLFGAPESQQPSAPRTAGEATREPDRGKASVAPSTTAVRTQAPPTPVLEVKAAPAPRVQAIPTSVPEVKALSPVRVAEPLLPGERLPMEEATPAWRRPKSQPGRSQVLSVSALTAQLKGLVEPSFSRVIVRGEVTGFRGPNARGHLYFALKDESSQLDVRVWQTLARTLRFALKDGLSVLIEGGLNVYEVQGRYSLIAQSVEPEGLGAMALAFEQLKARLVSEGLIGERRTRPRRPIPLVPRRIGVVTSASGAAWRDFLKVLHRRHPRLPVLLCDARVQGEDAALEVRRALRWLSRTDVDVIVVTRGGGSVEDLWTFNEESVVRAIFECPVPVVSAVGHEVDVTLADLVADLRAPTPSAAAEAVAPVLADLELGLSTTRRRLAKAVERGVLERRGSLNVLRRRLSDPRRQLTSRRLALSDHSERLRAVLTRRVRTNQKRIEGLAARLQRSRPQAMVAQRRVAFSALAERLRAAVARLVRDEHKALNRFRVGLERASPRHALLDARRRLETMKGQLPATMRRSSIARRTALDGLAARLDGLSPLKVLGRGYSIVSRTGDGVVVRRAAEVSAGDSLTVRLDQGDQVQVVVTVGGGGAADPGKRPS